MNPQKNQDEHLLAAKSSGILWLIAPPLLAASLLLPGTEDAQWRAVLLLTGLGMLWGATSLLLIPWERLTFKFGHLPTCLSIVFTIVFIAATGGASSPYSPLYFLIIAHTTYFFPRTEAILYVVACVAAFALPIAYDPAAVDQAWLGRSLIAAVVAAGLSGVVIAGKAQLVSLRETADEASRRDPLTGLANRRALSEAIAERVEGPSAGFESVGLVLLDLDDFKDVNTLHGHHGGDHVLCRVSDALQRTARSRDLVVRYGGDEFAILAAGVNEDGIRRLAERSISAVRACLDDADLPGVAVTASAGWVLYPSKVDGAAELLRIADLSMRAAKVSGKDRAHAPLSEVP